MGRVRELTRLPFEHAPREPTNTVARRARRRCPGRGFLGRNKKASVHFLLAKNLGSVSSQAKISSAAGLGLGKLSIWKT